MTSSAPVHLSIGTLLFRHSPKLLVTAVIFGVLAGGLYSLIIPLVLAALGEQKGAAATAATTAATGYGAAAFFSLCCLVLLTKAASIILINNIAKSATAQLRIDISARVGKMLVGDVESIGLPRLLNVLVSDVNHVAGAAVAIPMILVSTVTVVGMLGYLATLDLVIFGIVVVAIVLGVTMFQVPMGLAGQLYRRARDLRDTVQEGVRGLVHGTFELKLDSAKSVRYQHEELVQPQLESVRLEKIGDTMMHLGGTASDLLAFFIIGIVVYVLPHYVSASATTSYGVVMALLYISAPVSNILALLPHVRASQIALERILALFAQGEEVVSDSSAGVFDGWREISTHALSYQYQDADGKGFSVGPIDLCFRRGQVNFIIGGNGSGKTTLSKLLSLHYQPAGGEIRVDGAVVAAGNIASLRRHVSVIYSNYYLFRKLYRPAREHDARQVEQWLALLGLTGKTEFVDGQFSTTRLSDGQRRRLALLVVLLEDRDIYVFDEWAADQDPGFKRAFYETFLPEMKRNNKLVLVITHDDRYFACADRLIFMESGQILEIREQGAGNAPPFSMPP